MNPMTCKLCRHPRIAEIEALHRAGKITIEDASRELSASYQETWAHFNRCLAPLADEDAFEVYLNLMRELVNKLKDRVDDLDETPTTIVSVKMLTALVKELRGLIRDLGALEGRIQSGAIIQLNQVSDKYQKLTGIMFSGLCESCRAQMIAELERLENNPELEVMK